MRLTHFDLSKRLAAACGRTCGRRDFLKRATGFCAAYAGLATPDAASGAKAPERKRAMVRWQAHTIAKIPNGYHAEVADLNGDDYAGVVAVGASTANVKWYENLGA